MGALIVRKLTKSSGDDPPLPRCNSLNSVTCLPPKVTPVATALALPSAGQAVLTEQSTTSGTLNTNISPKRSTSGGGSCSDGGDNMTQDRIMEKAQPVFLFVSWLSWKDFERFLYAHRLSALCCQVRNPFKCPPFSERNDRCLLRLNDSFLFTDAGKKSAEITSAKMPKKTSTTERKGGSTRLFRSVSALSQGKKNKHENTHNIPKDDKHSSGLSGISDSEKVEVLVEHNTQIMEDKYGAIEENRKMRQDLKDATTKLQVAEREIENLKTMLGECSQESVKLLEEVEEVRSRKSSKGVIFPSKVEHIETTIEASGYPVRQNRTNPCKECEKLKQSKIKALVEAIALKKYARELSEALAGDDHSKQNILNELEKKLISAQTEKEIALEELAHVIEQRDQVVAERDRALEEWGRAATKWDSTLDQVDSVMTELSKVKAQRDELLLQIEKSEDSIKMEIDSREKLLEQQLQKTQTELAKAQQRCLELDAKLTSITEKSDTYHKERDHAKEQWRHSVKERKKLHREMAATVQARDEAIQKCFSTAEQLDKLKEDYNRLLNRLARTGIASGSESSTCSLKDCQFCSDSFGKEDDHLRFEGEEIKVSLDKDDPLASIKTGKILCRGREFTAIMDVEKALGAAKNLRKYDEIISINDIPVSEKDQNLVRSLLDSATSTVTMVLRRPTSNCQFTFDVDLKIPKKSKYGLGFECGLYVKDISFGGVASEQKSLEIGDYILKMNGKHLDKIIASSIEKVIKKSGDKMKFHITRMIQASSRHGTSKVVLVVTCAYRDDFDCVTETKSGCKKTNSDGCAFDFGKDFGPDGVIMRGGTASDRSRDVNRLSLISNDSSISMRSRDSRLSGASSLGSMVSNTDSCFADSSSDHSGHVLHSTPMFAERPRMATAVFHPTDLTREMHDGTPVEEGNESSELLTSDAKESDNEGSQARFGSLTRKYLSTGTMVRSNSGELSGLARAQSTITAIRIDEEPLEDSLTRPGKGEILTATGERARVIRLEKKPFKSLGIEVTGGNLVGIYVKEMSEDSVCRDVGVRTGDRLFKLNCYDLTRATLDHATRIVRLLSSCTYIRIEALHCPNCEEILKEPPYDSVYVRTIQPYKALSHDELDFTVGETLHVINTRANYDQARQSWKWVAMRARKDGRTVDEGLIPCMGSLPEQVESTVISQLNLKLESGSEECLSDEANAALKRGGAERKSLLQRYKKMRRRESRDHIAAVDVNGNFNKVVYYEILSKTK
ncbi:predicted protein [Nematostella vectensis]|uniref:PDZ domain-containing protein n=1 Tax=Nematostella vectensis TaxID=45351 RepID=A7RQC8_NEMVE|nr:predicted protein [Nematostella vectensis]|eukprot:XP_001638402.1 predicted protein [Nematostella vectensis]